MSTIHIQFHGEFNFFLPLERQKIRFEHIIDYKVSIKDLIESLGPPHTEVQSIVINDSYGVDFDFILSENDIYQVDVYSHANGAHTLLRPPYEGKARFILDTHLGRLASYLRMMGFDTLYRNDYPDDVLAEVSHNENRILLTRDIGVLKRSLVIYGRYVRNTDPRKQIVEVMRHYDLLDSVTPFHRCLNCNGRLHPVEKADITHLLPEKSALYYDEFHQCEDCNQVYWKGTHVEQMQSFIKEITG